MIISFSNSSSILYSHVNQRDWVAAGPNSARVRRQQIQAVISNERFETSLEFCLELLNPIEKIIVEAQSDDLPLSRVYHLCDTLMEELLKIEGLDQAQIAYLEVLWDHYWNFLYHDATGIAYLLDPFYYGKRLKLPNKKLIIKYICEWTADDGGLPPTRAHMDSVKDSILEFLSMAQDEAATDQGTAYTHPRKWWEVLGGHDFPLLRPIALRVFNMASGCASTERSFSTNNFIHSKLRNRLGEKILTSSRTSKSTKNTLVIPKD
jgi:ribosomal protein L17